jgi:hypothetical protein
VSLAQPISRTRSLEVAAGGGADRVLISSSEHYWRPHYFARFGTDIARSWTASASFTQSQNLLHSPLSAPDSYLTRSASVNVGGSLIRGTGLVISAGATRGEVPSAQSITGTAGNFTGLTGGAQVSFGLLRSLSAAVSANYFKSQLQGAANFARSSGVYQRMSARVGLTWSLPIYDSARRRR